MIFVNGATGLVGRPVVAQLLEMSVPVRALLCDSSRADLPASIDDVRRDLPDPRSSEERLDGVDAAFLL